MKQPIFEEELYGQIRKLLQRSGLPEVKPGGKGLIPRSNLRIYWLVGRLAWSLEKQRRVDSETVIRELAQRLAVDFGTAFPVRQLRNMYAFCRAFPEESSLKLELSWSHYLLLLKVSNEQARAFYHQEAADNHWSTRELARQISTHYYQRQQAPVKAHLVLEFLGLEQAGGVLERDLEDALLDKLQHFLLELGKGFAFVGRQKRVVTATGKHYYIDLAFYHYILKCFVLIDLKTGELSHRDIGQMDMYVRLYDDKWKQPGDNPTLGMILCTEKDQTVVQYSVLQESQQLFAATYQLYLPTAEELSEKLGASVTEAIWPEDAVGF